MKVKNLSVLVFVFSLFVLASCKKEASSNQDKEYSVVYKVISLVSTPVTKITYADKTQIKQETVALDNAEKTYMVAGVKKGFNATLKADAFFITDRSRGVTLIISVDGSEKKTQTFTNGTPEISYTIQ